MGGITPSLIQSKNNSMKTLSLQLNSINYSNLVFGEASTITPSTFRLLKKYLEDKGKQWKKFAKIKKKQRLYLSKKKVA